MAAPTAVVSYTVALELDGDAGQANGAIVTTIEGLAAADGALHPIQQAFWDSHGLQCGFCTPGMMMTIKALLAESPDADEAAIRDAISGNLCRCTGYETIVDAALDAAREIVRRVEDPRLISGQGRYLDDLAVAGVLHAAFVRSTHAHEGGVQHTGDGEI
eukprot:gene44505-60294_t